MRDENAERKPLSKLEVSQRCASASRAQSCRVGDLATLLTGLDAGERVRGRGFERLCKWVLENEPECAPLLERVWLWDEWPGNKGRTDAGIDLVARTRDGRLWAIQAKHYDQVHAIRKADLDSFLSESSCLSASCCLLSALLALRVRGVVQRGEGPAGPSTSFCGYSERVDPGQHRGDVDSGRIADAAAVGVGDIRVD